MHQSVMPKEVLFWLQPRSEGIYLDGTVGEGGHSEAILETSSPDGRVIGLDRDPNAVAAARERLAQFGTRGMIVQADYRSASAVLEQMSIVKVDGVVLDLGV